MSKIQAWIKKRPMLFQPTGQLSFLKTLLKSNKKKKRRPIPEFKRQFQQRLRVTERLRPKIFDKFLGSKFLGMTVGEVSGLLSSKGLLKQLRR